MATATVLKHSIDLATLESRAVRSQGAFGALEFPGAARSYGRNEEIFGEGGRADYFYRIVSGTVRLYRVLADGRRQIASFQFEGDVFGVEASEYRHLSAEAVNDCEIVATPRTAVLRHAERNGEFARRMWARAVTDLAEAYDHLLVLGRQTAAEKVMSFLVDVADRQATDNLVKLTMSRQDIADYLGLTIETVSRTLTQLERRGALEVKSARRIELRSGAPRLLDS